MHFSLALKKIRHNLKFTQKEMVQYLQYMLSSCSLLDEVSYSRWENNKTKPSFRKKIDILYLLDDKISLQKIVNSNHKKSMEITKKINSLLMSRYVSMNEIDNSPYTENPYKIITQQEEIDLNKLENIFLKYHKNAYGCNKDLDYFKQLKPSKYKSILYRFIDSNNKLIGHAIFIITKSINLTSIHNGYTNIIKNCNNIKDDYDLYLLSSYTNSQKTSHLLYEILIKLNHDYKIKETIIKARNIQSATLINYIGGEIKFFGLKDDKGIPIGKNKYSWIGYSVYNKNILSLPNLK